MGYDHRRDRRHYRDAVPDTRIPGGDEMTHLIDPNNHLPQTLTDLIPLGLFWAAMALWVWWPWRTRYVTPKPPPRDAPPTRD